MPAPQHAERTHFLLLNPSFHRFGTAYRIRQDDLDAYLAAARRPAPQLFDGFVDAVVNAAPQLTDEQRQQLVTVLGGVKH